jgi:hypothetical protein
MAMVDIMSDLLVEDRYGPRTMTCMIVEDEKRRYERKHQPERMTSPVRMGIYSQVTQWKDENVPAKPTP